MAVIGVLIGVFGCLAGSILVATAVSISLPLLAVFALTSAVWTGEPGPPSFLLEARSRLDVSSAAADPVDSLQDGEDATAPPKRKIQIGGARHPDSGVAIRSYYFGPVADDATDSFQAIVLICTTVRKLAAEAARNSQDGFEAGVLQVVIPFSINVGLPVGFVAGILVTAVLWLTYLLVSAVSVGVALCLRLALRGLDSVCNFAAGRTCPSCGGRVLTCAHYLCPECGTRHRDIRPGPYGVFHRVCTCGGKMPTMLVTGAAKLQGICPADDCKGYLPPMFGRAAEIIIPFFGPTNSGKTRLMYMMVTALREWVNDQNGKVTYIGDASERLDMIGDSLATTEHTEKTIVERPRGLGLFIKFGLNRRFVYFFDAAGEMYTRRERLVELKYLDKAPAYIFVADPLAAKAVWSQLPSAEQAGLQRFRAPHRDVEGAFQATINHMLKVVERRGLRGRPSDLAFVVSKLDLLESAGLSVQSLSGSTEQWVRSADGLNLGNVARRASHSFGNVEYFCTAALAADGRVDSSVDELLRWILERSGIRLEV